MRLAFAASLLLLALVAPTASAEAAETRIIVKRDAGLSAAERADIRADAGVRLVRSLRIANAEVVTTSDPKGALAELRGDPDVRYAEIDRVRHAFVSDADFDLQWALSNDGGNLQRNFVGGPAGTPDADMDVPEAWDRGAKGAGVKVAVVDSGVEENHPDLSGQIDAALSRGFLNLDGSDTGYADDEGHGTHVSGIIAAASNTVGVAGIAPEARVVALKALDGTGSGTDSAIASAFDYAGDHDIPIVNASLGGPGASDLLTEAIASHPNTLYVVAAGNDELDNDAQDIWPCNVPAPNVVCVGASTQDDARADFSDYGRTTVDLFAPGEHIWSTVLDPEDPLREYDLFSGTSMASPAVAAEAALVLGAGSSVTTAELKRVLLSATDSKPQFACNSVTGGRANADAAVALATAPPATSAVALCDPDGDGVDSGVDECLSQVGPASNGGCPVTTTTSGNTGGTTTTTTPNTTNTAVDSDGDGRSDALDGCPAVAAATADGCPVPALRSVAVKVAKRTRKTTAIVRTDRAATVSLRMERKRCGRKCRWVLVMSSVRATRSDRAAFSRRLARGRYRVKIVLSSSAGRSAPQLKSFRVR